MNHREKIKFQQEKLGLKITDEQAIERVVNILIDALYIPVEGFGGVTKVDPERIKHFGIEDKYEAINWGDLNCDEVQKLANGSFIITIDEAAPDSCPTFCDYIQKHMKSYGWEVIVKTEW